MFSALVARFKQGQRTIPFPDKPPVLPDRFQGLPEIHAGRCDSSCRACIEVCPTEAVARHDHAVQIDLGRCLFCGECRKACPAEAVNFSGDYRMAVQNRQDLIVGSTPYRLAERLAEEIQRILGRSLRLRQVCAGGCGACEADTNVLGTVTYDLGRFGIQFVASPRHADGLLITGPVTEHMVSALRTTYEAIPAPKIVIASGACAISGGPYRGHPEVKNGCTNILSVDLFIPGCPPHPVTLLDGLLRLIGRIE